MRSPAMSLPRPINIHVADGQLNYRPLVKMACYREAGCGSRHDEIRRRNLNPTDAPHPTEPHKTQLEKETQERWFPLSWHRWGYGLYGHSYLDDIDRKSKIQLKTKFFVCAGLRFYNNLKLPDLSSYRQNAKKTQDKAPMMPVFPSIWPQVFSGMESTTFLWIAGTIAACSIRGFESADFYLVVPSN